MTFGDINERDQRELARLAYKFLNETDDRQQAIVDRFDLLIDALAAGMRAAADVLSRNRR